MKKLIKILLISIAFLVGGSSPTYATHTFKDVPTAHTNYDDIQFLVEQGIIDKTTNYGVKNDATRLDVVVMLGKALNLNDKPTTTDFKDIEKSHVASGYIQQAVEKGIVKGYADGTFKPNQTVTRGHVATFISRAYDLPTGSTTFKDVGKTNTAYEAVAHLAAANITTGYTDGTFKPNQTITKGQLATFIARAVRYQEDSLGSIKKPSSKQLEVHHIDVGQGDSTLIKLPNGKSVLIDGGSKSEGSTVVTYLKKQGVKTLDYVIATHPDADHIGGLIEVMDTFKVKHFMSSGKTHTTQTYEDLLTAVNRSKARYTEPILGETLDLDPNITIRILNSASSTSDNNDASILLRMTYNKVSFLFMADADTDIEQLIAKRFTLLANYVKAGHHGSDSSSSLDFLKQVKPQAVILSYGADNSYGHPHGEVLSNIQRVGATAYATGGNGAVVIKTNGTKHSIAGKVLTENNMK